MLSHFISLILNIYYLIYYISIISTYTERYNNTVYHSGEITSSYSQNLVYLVSGNRCDIKYQGKSSQYLLSPGQRNLFLDIQTTTIIWEMIMPENTARNWPIS